MRALFTTVAVIALVAPVLRADDCADHDRLRSLVQLNGVLALWGAAEFLPEGASVCEGIWGQ